MSPPHVRVADGLLSDDRVDLSELLTEEVQLTQSGVDGQTLIDGQLLLGDASRTGCWPDSGP
jgi:hypothetical protein